MLESLGRLAGSEYNNAGELMGLGEIDDELFGYLGQLNPITRFKVMKKLYSKPTGSRGSRAEMEKFLAELPPNIKKDLESGKLRLADGVIYSIKAINGAKTIKLFESQDIKQTNLKNISGGRLPKNTALMVSGIFMLYGVAASKDPEDLMSTRYGSIIDCPALSNGEFNLKANKKQIVDPMNNEVFVTDNNHTVQLGYYKLDNPRLIHDDVDIEFEVELGTVRGIPDNGAIKIGLHGTLTIP